MSTYGRGARLLHVGGLCIDQHDLLLAVVVQGTLQTLLVEDQTPLSSRHLGLQQGRVNVHGLPLWC